jgi:hypothetical protein
MWEHDSRLDAKPDFGTLGSDPAATSDGPIRVPSRGMQAPWAVLVGVLAALAVVAIDGGVARAGWQQLSHYLPLQGKAEPASPAILSEREAERLNHESPQRQTESLLERAINHYEGATDQIAQRVDGWHGHIKLSPQLSSLITTGLNSNDLHVRAATIEVDLAALNVAKTSESIGSLERQAQAGSQQQRIWALWTLGLLGNRGVEPERVNEILSSGLRDSDPEIRHWAVEGLSYLGTDETLEPLLRTFHDDPSPMVRESAACGLAQSGMLSEQQRRSIVPKLLDFAEDTSLDAQTHSWVFHALRDITAQNLPDNSAAWRSWYEGAGR